MTHRIVRRLVEKNFYDDEFMMSSVLQYLAEELYFLRYSTQKHIRCDQLNHLLNLEEVGAALAVSEYQGRFA